MLGDESFREFRCDWCGMIAYVCAADDRGQIYCSFGCRSVGNRRRLKEARDRYRADPEVREYHRDYMREWRTRRREQRERVRDHGPQKLAPLAEVCLATAPTATTTVALANDARSVPDDPTEAGAQAPSRCDAALDDALRGRAFARGAAASTGASAAAPTLLEGLALWLGRPLSVALCAADSDALSALSLSDGFGFGSETVHYEVEVVDPARRPRGLGPFRDLRQLVLRGAR